MLLLGVFLLSAAATLLLQAWVGVPGLTNPDRKGAPSVLSIRPEVELPYLPETRLERGLSGELLRNGHHYRELGYRYQGDTIYVRICPEVPSGRLTRALVRIIKILPAPSKTPLGPRKGQTAPTRILLMQPRYRDQTLLQETLRFCFSGGPGGPLVHRPHTPSSPPPDLQGPAFCA